MLQKLNERIQGIVAWVVIVLIAVTFTLFGVDYYLQSHHASDAEITVNDQPITKQAFELSYRRERQQHDPAQMSAASEVALKKQVLDEMVNNLVAVQAAQHAGFDVTFEQANAAIMSIPQFQQDGHFSAERYQQALSGAMFTPDSFRKEVRQGMLLNQQRFAFIGTAFVLPNEVKRFVKLYMQMRDYSYLIIPARLFFDKTKITEQEINSYYDKNPKQFIAPEKVVVDYIKLSVQDIKQKVGVSEKQVKRYYEENQNNFLTPARWHVAHILFAVPKDASEEVEDQAREQAQTAFANLQKDPEQFGQLVKSLSADKMTVNTDGLLPWIKAGQSNFDKTLSELTTVGQISAPLKTENGYEIFKLIDFKPAKIKPYAEVRIQIAEQLKAEIVQTRYNKLLEQLSDQAYQTPDSLTPVAEALNLAVLQTEAFTRAGGTKDITKNKQFINTAFSHDVLNLGNNSEPLQLDNDTVIVLRVNKHIAASKKTKDEVRDEIINHLAQQQAEIKAQAFAEHLLSLKIDSEEDNNLLEANQLQWQSIEKATRDTDKADAMINDLAFSLAKPTNQNVRRIANGDFAIVKLTKIDNGKMKALDKEQQANIAQQIESSYGLMDYDLYLNNLLASAKLSKS